MLFLLLLLLFILSAAVWLSQELADASGWGKASGTDESLMPEPISEDSGPRPKGTGACSAPTVS